jgi:hypothetical protein
VLSSRDILPELVGEGHSQLTDNSCTRPFAGVSVMFLRGDRLLLLIALHRG